MKKFLKIRDSNRFIYFKNRKVRTPTVIEVTDSDLKTIHITLKMADVQDFEIVLEEDCNKKKEDIDIPPNEDKIVVIEELEEVDEIIGPSTILEEYMRNGEKQ